MILKISYFYVNLQQQKKKNEQIDKKNKTQKTGAIMLSVN